MKRQSTKWKEIFVNLISDKKLISKIYKELIQVNSIKQTIQLKTGQRTSIGIFQKKIHRWPTDT